MEKNKRKILVLSNRKSEKQLYWQVVFEWEDEFENYFNSKIINKHSSELNGFLDRIKRKIDTIIIKIRDKYYNNQKDTFFLQFNMSPFQQTWRSNKKYIVPCVLDFVIDKEDLPLFYANYAQNPFVLISDLDAVFYLKSVNCPLKIYHFPLSISDKYILKYEESRKKYDCIVVGRQNNTKMIKWLEEYAKQNSDFVYVYRQDNSDFSYYTNKGEFIGKIKNREQYMNLLSLGKVGLYTTACAGKGFVTPRFLEYLVSGCHVITSFTENKDTDFFQLSSMCENTLNYEHFKEQMDKFRTQSIDVMKYQNYLKKHYTSQRAALLTQIVFNHFNNIEE